MLNNQSWELHLLLLLDSPQDLRRVPGGAAQELRGPGSPQDQTPAQGALGGCLEPPSIAEVSHHPGGGLGRGQPLWGLRG